MEHNPGTIGVSQRVIISNDEGKILTIRRTATAPSRPLRWDLPGGILEFGEETDKGIKREIKEETGLDVEALAVMDARSNFNDRNEFWVTICYTATHAGGEISLSDEHDDYKWVTLDEFQNLKASPRNQEFVKHFEKLRTQT